MRGLGVKTNCTSTGTAKSQTRRRLKEHATRGNGLAGGWGLVYKGAPWRKGSAVQSRASSNRIRLCAGGLGQGTNTHLLARLGSRHGGVPPWHKRGRREGDAGLMAARQEGAHAETGPPLSGRLLIGLVVRRGEWSRGGEACKGGETSQSGGRSRPPM
jgi:hypothetical protein